MFKYQCSKCDLIMNFFNDQGKYAECVSCKSSSIKIFESLEFDINGHSESERKLVIREEKYWNKKLSLNKKPKKRSKQILGEYF